MILVEGTDGAWTPGMDSLVSVMMGSVAPSVIEVRVLQTSTNCKTYDCIRIFCICVFFSCIWTNVSNIFNSIQFNSLFQTKVHTHVHNIYKIKYNVYLSLNTDKKSQRNTV